MASELTTTGPHPTALPAPASAVGWLRHLLPFRAVVLPWLVARMVLVPALALADGPGGMNLARLIWMDGQWFRLIAIDWYDRPYADGFWSEYPFFPLLPAVGGALDENRVPSDGGPGGNLVARRARGAGRCLPAGHAPPFGNHGAVGTVVPCHRAGRTDHGDGIRRQSLSCRCDLGLRLGGGSRLVGLRVGGTRRHSEQAERVHRRRRRRRDGACRAAGARALAAVVAPSLLFLLAWCWYLWSATDDPFVFWSAKEAWSELSVTTVLADPLTPRNEPGTFHLVAMAALLVPYALRVRRQPLAWGCFTALGLLPSLALGVEGMARYAVLAFPVPFAAADVLAGRRRWPAVLFLVASGLAAIALAVLMVRQSWLP